MSKPSLSSLGLRAQLAVVLRLIGWSYADVSRILGVHSKFSTEALRRLGVPYALTPPSHPNYRLRETRPRGTRVPLRP